MIRFPDSLSIYAALVMLGAGAFQVPVHSQAARPLFDGATLKGWKILGNGSWTVVDGAIVAKLAKSDPQFTHLLYDSTFKDFTFTFKFRHVKGNAGFFFRLEQKDPTPAGVAGLQVVIEPTLPLPDAFGLYETGGRLWVKKWDYAAKKSLYKPGEWNTIKVEAKGTRILVELNGSEIVLLPNDAAGRLQGKLAFKLHGGQDVEIHFKDMILGEGTPTGVLREAGAPAFSGKAARGKAARTQAYSLEGKRRSPVSKGRSRKSVPPLP